jgi:hypothetical protein
MWKSSRIDPWLVEKTHRQISGSKIIKLKHWMDSIRCVCAAEMSGQQTEQGMRRRHANDKSKKGRGMYTQAERELTYTL